MKMKVTILWLPLGSKLGIQRETGHSVEELGLCRSFIVNKFTSSQGQTHFQVVLDNISIYLQMCEDNQIKPQAMGDN